MNGPIALRLLLVAMPVVTNACTLAGCDDIAIAGIRLHVRDAVTGEGVTRPVVAVVREAAYVDTLLGFWGDSLFAGAHERPGTYRVEVTGSGYQFWQRDGVRVRKDGCHVRTVDVDVQLTPTSPPN